MKPITKKQWRELCAKHASREFGRIITVKDLGADQGKFRPMLWWRYYAMGVLWAHGFSLPRSAAVLGYDDHTSILNGLRRAHGHDGKLKNEPLWTKEHFEKVALADEAEFIGVEWVAA